MKVFVAVIAGLSVLVLMVAIYWVSTIPAPSEMKVSKLVVAIDDGPEIDNFKLQSTSHEGVLDNSSLEGHWTYLVFGYTHCPDVCPTTLNTLAKVTQKLGTEKSPLVVFVSVDWPRDNVTILKQYVTSFDKSFIGATGSDEALKPLVKSLSAYYQRNNQHDTIKDGYTVDHTSSVFLINTKGQVRAALTMPGTVDQIVSDTNQLMSHH
ncbi:MAG: SCO family protein [Ferrovum sp. 37-45-19]|jgi:protein SCO1/2|uniref:SCO family protein n=1 Tax=Ferrovum sp. JA12 TaxID=1356299 RepID=UPI000703C04F|nr:SCO family protein [Ferrovum sp. JA12]OYV80467.1 MAG: SCO family protein [Ferrovum sp. 21-44-67]OYV94782.1 MAG: SCO family protein [Ferrovum sp. 37-45-19]OZB31923.1 MAG: SCO family protein [Ferrovum sp. 34-44-207]HQT81098.1 SCO family protein [Ferrovaceae bacterium]KRH79176.1 SCO1/SenC [Ferrovum sp. JA12]